MELGWFYSPRQIAKYFPSRFTTLKTAANQAQESLGRRPYARWPSMGHVWHRLRFLGLGCVRFLHCVSHLYVGVVPARMTKLRR